MHLRELDQVLTINCGCASHRPVLDCNPSCTAAILMVYLPTLDEVTTLRQRGALKPDDVMKVCVYVCVSVCSGGSRNWGGHQ